MTTILKAIQSDLARQGKQLALLTEKSDAEKHLPELSPRERDWNEPALHEWYQSLIPTKRKLANMGESFCDRLLTLSPYLDHPQVFVPYHLLPVARKIRLHAKSEYRQDIRLLRQRWPRKLTDTPDSDDCPIPDKDSLAIYFNWHFPGPFCKYFAIDKLEMQYDSQGYTEVRVEGRKVCLGIQ
jgi:hypothetical protein